jgi:7,8-dihydropterin-6-yl-methyl-4-(beta-D-ribofuranosyl)aminobenzene 5'-phosphate synthase
MSTKITTVVENHDNKALGMEGEHGLSLFIEKDGRKILFDTGQTDLLIENAAKLKIDLSSLDGVILSHGHYDHTGGVPALRKEGGYRGEIFASGGFWDKKYKKLPDGTWKYNGVPYGKEEQNVTLLPEEEITEKYGIRIFQKILIPHLLNSQIQSFVSTKISWICLKMRSFLELRPKKESL